MIPLAPDAFAGQVAVVTGGGGGIGSAAALALAQHGATVVIADIDEALAEAAAKEVNQAGGRAIAHTVDVRDGAAIDLLKDAVLRDHGRVDILVNNAGHWVALRQSFMEEDPELWEQLYQINLRHIFQVTYAFLPSMLERRSGRIINVSSIEGMRGYPNAPVYAAFKAAVVQFTRSLGVQVALDGVRINGIAPDLTRSIQCDHASVYGPGEADHWPRWIPIGREGTPEDQAGVILFLASELSSFLIGHTVPVDGGTGAAGGWYRSQHRKRPFTNFPYDA
jgi:NAD(P)-dependent dehydrogenase (short-subunit alcohol dehydrogenase family)